MDSSLIPIFILVIIAFVVITWLSNRKRRAPIDRALPIDQEEQLQDFPYTVQSHFLSPAELSFFQVLRGVVEERALISAKVGLGDVFSVNVADRSQFRAYRNKIDRKHVDFLLCDPATMQPVVGIELDDKSHERADRQERDEFVDGVFAAAKLPLLHVLAKRAYVASELETQIAPYLTGTPQPVRSASPTPTNSDSARSVTKLASAAPENQAPRCPICGSEMIMRTARSGANAGTKFWGCSTYPNCRGMINISQA
jgi:predicted RNA-binding Zn-ribbon protein involved in translation (DUF1610 family)